MWGLTQVNESNLSYIVGLISGNNECVVVPLKFDYGVDVPLLVSEMDELVLICIFYCINQSIIDLSIMVTNTFLFCYRLAIKNKSDDQLTTENLVDAIRNALGKRTTVSKLM